MPSIAFGEARSATSTHVVHVVADVVKIDDAEVITDAGGAGIGRMAASLLTGATEIRTTEVDTARRARSVVDRLLAARAEL